MVSYRLPNIDAPDIKGQISQLHSYLRRLVDEMNFNIQAQEEAAQKKQEEREANQEKTFTAIRCYPVGSLYLSVSAASPQTLFGGRWEQMKDRFLLAAGDSYAAGSIGGEASVSLTEAQIPKGTVEGTEQAMTVCTGNGEPHNNMPPYLAVYVWKRIA